MLTVVAKNSDAGRNQILDSRFLQRFGGLKMVFRYKYAHLFFTVRWRMGLL